MDKEVNSCKFSNKFLLLHIRIKEGAVGAGAASRYGSGSATLIININIMGFHFINSITVHICHGLRKNTLLAYYRYFLSLLIIR
jgi:hypothetical protein